jgi:CubicO group peptidase (beta-lactamase class C family)
MFRPLLLISSILLGFAQAVAQPPAAQPNQPPPPQELPPGLALQREVQGPDGKKFKIQLPLGQERRLPRGEMIQGFPRGGFNPQRLQVMHETTKRFVDEGKHAGIVTLLARNGRVADVFAAGFRDVEKKLPMTPDTICRMYSTSKIVTCVATLICMEDGKFNLDDPVSAYLPEMANMQVWTGGTAEAPKLEKQKRPMTIKQLMTHTTGLVYDFSAGNEEIAKLYRNADIWNAKGLPDFVTRVSKLPLKHQPGDAWTYGIGQDIQGALIEKVTGKPFGVFLRERIFFPLGMIDTDFDVPPEKMDRVAKTYKLDGGKFVEDKPIVETWPEKGRGIEAGGAGIFSTAVDFGRFATMLANGGSLDGQRILSRKSVELMSANHIQMLPNNQAAARDKGFGLGVEVITDVGRVSVPSSVGQFGWYGAATTYCQIDPKERLAAVALVQHFPFNQHGIFQKFQTGYYQALE